MTHPTQPDPFQQRELWSHPDKPVIELVAVRGVCMRLRPLDAPVRAGEPCGLIHTRCAGHVVGSRPTRRQQRGDPCGSPALNGGACCRAHAVGGERTREQIVSTKKAMDECILLGIPVEIDPAEALLAELYQAKGMTEWLLAALREAVDASGLTWGKVEHRSGFGPEGEIDVTTYRAVAPVLYELYDRERKYLVEVATRCLKANVEERRTRLAEEAGSREAKLLEEFARRTGLDMQAPETHDAIRASFRVVNGGLAS